MTFLGIDAKQFHAGLDAAQAKAGSVGKKIGSSLAGGAGELLSAFAPALSVAAIATASKSVIDYAGHIKDLSDRTGITTDALQEWDYALQQSGSSVDSAVGFFEKLSIAKRAAADGDAKAIAAFQKFGISLKEIATMPVEEIGTRIADVVKSGDVEELVPYLRDIGGKSATELVAAFKSGIGGLRTEAQEVGAIIDEEAINKMDEFGDKIGSVWTRIKSGLAVIITPIIDLITSILDKAEELGAFIGGVAGTGTIHGGHEAVNDVKAERAKKAEAAAAKKGTGFGLGEGEGKVSKETEKAEQAEKKLADIRQKNWFDSLSREQKIAILKKEAQLADEKNILTKDRAERAALMVRGEEAKAQLASLLGNPGETKSALKTSDPKLQIDALQSAGAYVRGDSKLLTPIQQSERHLRELLSITKQNPNTISGF